MSHQDGKCLKGNGWFCTAGKMEPLGLSRFFFFFFFPMEKFMLGEARKINEVKIYESDIFLTFLTCHPIP